MIRRILVGLAGTPYTAVSIRAAIDLATLHGAALTGVTILDLNALENVGAVPVGGSGAAKEWREFRVKVTRERVELDVADFTSACQHAGVDYEIRRGERDAAFDYLISQSRYHDLMVFGLRSIFEYDVAGAPISDRCILLVRLIEAGVRRIVTVAPEYREIQRVVNAYSGSMESAKTMKQVRPASSLAKRKGLHRHVSTQAAAARRRGTVLPNTRHRSGNAAVRPSCQEAAAFRSAGLGSRLDCARQ